MRLFAARSSRATKPRSSRPARLRIEPLEERRLLSVTPIVLGDATIQREFVRPEQYTEVGDTTLFWTDDGIHGSELWRTDGTEEGTVLLKDINPGAIGSLDITSTPIVSDGWMYFSATTRNGEELWKSDGTAEGTTHVASVNVFDFAEVNGVVFFTGQQRFVGRGLWTTDGTTATLVRQMDTGIRDLIEANGIMYFAGRDAVHGSELWSSDGTAEGTVLLADINPGSGSSGILELTNLGTHVVFIADDGIHGREPWSFDIADGTTKLIADIAPGSSTSLASGIGHNLTTMGGHVYFRADDGIHGDELWRTDGETASLVKDIRAGSLSSYPNELTSLDGTLVFVAYHDSYGAELWKSDGTEAGTELLKDIHAGAASSVAMNGNPLVELAGALYFSVRTEDDRVSLWRTDGSADGTWLVSDALAPNIYRPEELTSSNGLLYFSEIGGEVWRSDGTYAGTHLAAATNTASRTDAAAVATDVYFRGTDPVHGSELWISDRTDAGTRLAKDIYLGPQSSFPTELIELDGSLFFRATVDGRTTEPWWSNGTEAGTQLIKAIREVDEFGSNPEVLTTHAGIVYFAADDGVHGAELWRTDGTAAGTWLVKDIQEGNAGAMPYAPVASGGFPFYFAADDGIHGLELWRSDGTAAGTWMVADVLPGMHGAFDNSSNPPAMLAVNGRLYFWASAWNGNLQLWTSDGTATGTIQLTGFPDDQLDRTRFSPVVSFNGARYFTAERRGYGKGLWRTDGTPGGTQLVKELTPAANGYGALELTLVKDVLYGLDQLYFAAYDPEHGVELWRSDGTEACTVLVEDLLPGPESSAPVNLTAVGGVLYFSAYDEQHGFELWSSGGHPSNTSVIDVLPGPRSSSPSSLLNVAGSLFFTAVDDTYTARPMLLPLNQSAPTGLWLGSNDINEHALPATAVGKIHPIDADGGSRYTFRLLDDAGGRFGILRRDLLVAKNPALLDYETDTSHTVVIEVTDSGGLTFTQSFTIEVKDRQERFFVAGADAGGGPHVRLFDAVSSAPMYAFYPYNVNFTGGVRVATGDVNGDGMPDVITAPGPGGGPHIRVFHGSSSQQLPGWSFMAFDIGFSGGVSIAAADLNGDGQADIVAAADAGGGPHVRVYSGKDGGLMTEFFAFDYDFRGGVRVAVGDVNGDGRLDLIASMGAGDEPLVRTFLQYGDGVNFVAAESLLAFNKLFAGGVYVASGDVNGDRIDDIIVGAGAGGGPHVRVFSGDDQRELASLFPYAITFAGGVRVAAADFDLDGRSEIVTGAGPGGGPHALVLRADTQQAMFSTFAFVEYFRGGIFVAAGDVATNLASEPLLLTHAATSNPSSLAAAVEFPLGTAEQATDALFAELDAENDLVPQLRTSQTPQAAASTASAADNRTISAVTSTEQYEPLANPTSTDDWHWRIEESLWAEDALL